jgi:hypothetical protein
MKELTMNEKKIFHVTDVLLTLFNQHYQGDITDNDIGEIHNILHNLVANVILNTFNDDNPREVFIESAHLVHQNTLIVIENHLDKLKKPQTH